MSATGNDGSPRSREAPAEHEASSSALGWRLAATLLLLVLTFSAFAQDRPPTLDDYPLIRSQPNFYGALDVSGNGVKVAWSAPNIVTRDTEFTLTLTVSGAANPHELIRPNLRDLDEFKQLFQFLDKPDHKEPAADRSAKEVQFNYRLVPRNLGKTSIPALTYVYYRPKLDQLQTTYAKSRPLSVEAPKSITTGPAIPIEAPEEFFTLAPNESSAWTPGLFAWVLPVAAAPLVVGGWLLLWRVFFPDAARLAKLRRNRATRTALDRLKKAHTSADPAGAAAFAFRQYLTSRFGVPPSAQTPTEVSAALRDAEQPADRAADAEAFLRACDATRFDQSSDTGLSLVKQAESLVTTWEGGAT